MMSQLNVFNRLKHTIVLLLMSALLGCSAKIVPPDDAKVMRQVWVLNHGRHSSLILQKADGDLMRYSYGDWRFYAQGKTSLFSGLRAISVPTKAALGRKQLFGPATLDRVKQQLSIAVVDAVSIQADADQVEQLQQQLESIYRHNRSAMIYRQAYDLKFVPHPDRYHLLHNSNQVVGQWLIELGSEIRGWPLLSDWQVVADGAS